jgi:L-threonylcarbamoyladenylate synthase
MNTILLKDNENDIKKAGEILSKGGLVGIPTETVYGLAANALDGKAVAKIFQAKGRPMDNPLIVHIQDISDIEKFNLVSEFSDKAKALAKKFWPGPLTIIMPKGEAIPDEVSAGLDTVAIRFPEHRVAREIIKAADKPLAAPSANLSGSPSPTSAKHVLNDLDGRIDAVLDGGHSRVGLESTVITLATEKPRLLRPGGITLEQLTDVIGEIDVDSAVFNKLDQNAKVASPGMKYKHYAPKARVILLKGSDSAYKDYVNSHCDYHVAALCYDSDIAGLSVTTFSMGSKDDYSTQAHKLFSSLRKIDKEERITVVYARCPEPYGLGMAVYNRLIRAAGFEVRNLEEV